MGFQHANGAKYLSIASKNNNKPKFATVVVLPAFTFSETSFYLDPNMFKK
jgi:hypothetical protein